MVHPGWLLAASAALQIVGGLGIEAWKVAIEEGVRADDLVSPAVIAGRYQMWALAGELLLVVESLILLAAVGAMLRSAVSWATLSALAALLVVLLGVGAGHFVEAAAAWEMLGPVISLAYLVGLTTGGFDVAWRTGSRGFALGMLVVGGVAVVCMATEWATVGQMASFAAASLALAVGVMAGRRGQDSAG